MLIPIFSSRPERLVSRIDDVCANNQQMTRSAFLAMSAQKMLSVNTMDSEDYPSEKEYDSF